MKALFFKRTAFIGIYILLAILLEMITFLSLGLGFLPKYFLMDLAVIIIISAFIFILPSFTAQTIVIVLMLAIQGLLSFLNFALYHIDGCIFVFEMISLGQEAAAAFDSKFINYAFLFGIFIIVLVGLGILLYLSKYKVKQNLKFNAIIVMVMAVCLMQFSGSSIYKGIAKNLYSPSTDDELYQLESDKYLYDTFFIKSEALKKFGTYTFYLKNLDRMLFNKNIQNDEEKLKVLDKFFEDGKKLNAKTENFGKLKDNNVIVIMMESAEWFGINQEYTPTLYALSNQGIKYSNYHSKDKTNFSEAIGFLGSYPTQKGFTNNLSSDDDLLKNNLVFSMPNVLREEGYDSNFFHTYLGTFFGRNATHKTYGFDEVITLEDFYKDIPSYNSDKFGDWILDAEFFEKEAGRIAPKGDKFYSFITTVSTHGPYDHAKVFENTGYMEKITKYPSSIVNVKNMEDLGEGVFEDYQEYQAGLMDLDKGVNTLLTYLKSNDLLKDTTLMLYADHHAYYGDLNYYFRDMEVNNYYNPELYKVPAFLYDGSMPLEIGGQIFVDKTSVPKIEPQNLTRFTSSFEITPTLLDLLGIEYNPNMYMGNSIFSGNETEMAFMSRLSGIFTDKIYSDNGKDILYSTTKLTVQEINDYKLKVKKYLTKQDMYELMYLTDYFKTRTWEQTLKK